MIITSLGQQYPKSSVSKFFLRGIHCNHSMTPTTAALILMIRIVTSATIRGQPFEFLISVAATPVLASDVTAMDIVVASAFERLKDRSALELSSNRCVPAPLWAAKAQVTVKARRRIYVKSQHCSSWSSTK